MKYFYDINTNTLTIELGTTAAKDISHELFETEIEGLEDMPEVSAKVIAYMHELLVENNVTEFQLDDIIKEAEGSSPKQEEQREADFDIHEAAEEAEKDKEYSEFKAEEYSNKVGVWFRTKISQGYLIKKARVSRGYTCEAVKFEDGIRLRKRLVGEEITLLKMIADEMRPNVCGCAARPILDIQSEEYDDGLYVKLLLNESIEVDYHLVKEVPVKKVEKWDF